MEEQGQRESAYAVFIDRAKRLEARALAYRTIAHLIKTNELTDAEEANLWNLAVGVND